ncbi:MAG: ribonuclease HIII [Candidatus Zixiibacteriota bacterium]|nr:MAG: ribonuclease HIII [candidate division Zixibacteria bacterium]
MAASRRIIGVDESGKGDFFGPLVIASFLADDSERALLKTLGVRDGKLISDNRIREIDRALRSDFAHCVVVISPQKYNRLYERLRNLNKMLAQGHARAIDDLVASNVADMAISDKFGKPELVEAALARKKQAVKLRQIVRGEAVPQVAAASILARARFMAELEKLSAGLDFPLPRGAAAQVDEAGRRLLRKHGPDVLRRVAKIHFKNYARIVHPSLFSK